MFLHFVRNYNKNALIPQPNVISVLPLLRTATSLPPRSHLKKGFCLSRPPSLHMKSGSALYCELVWRQHFFPTVLLLFPSTNLSKYVHDWLFNPLKNQILGVSLSLAVNYSQLNLSALLLRLPRQLRGKRGKCHISTWILSKLCKHRDLWRVLFLPVCH